MTSATHLDATTLVERIRDHLPIGSAQSYAAMLVLNYLITYSDAYGIQIQERSRPAVTSLSLEFLYLAWCHDVGIELSESQMPHWPPRVWKDSESLGIDLRLLLKKRHLPNHDKLRDVRTLLSFGALVNHYYESLKAQAGGLDGLKDLFCPPTLERLKFPLQTIPGTYAFGVDDKTEYSEWGWPFAWKKSPKSESQTSLLEPLAIPGSMPPPSMNLLPLYVTETTMHCQDTHGPPPSLLSPASSVSSFPSSSIPSSGTDSSIGTQISALERLEAYLSVLGTPQCDPIKPIPVKVPRLATLETAEEMIETPNLQEPLRPPTKNPIAPLVTFYQRELPTRVDGSTRPLRWLTAGELRSQKSQSIVNHRLEVVKGKQVPKRQQSKATAKVSGLNPYSGLPKILPLNIVKKSQIAVN
ncbi:hypothetical protein CTheo_2115 [Ceratobasidium theobromae]|uniref:Uncharacterized protein n=1 Tax=Ceratobasidium theobromae TaxID=1582974 RepID=A0A5N5QRZ9_9AGAM|nr:hypothetical protein CTheo_2115 [Ceratobasidium theobromae]